MALSCCRSRQRRCGSFAAAGEVVAGAESVGMIRTQDPLVVAQHLLAQVEGVLDLPGSAVGGGEVMAGPESVGVVGAQDPRSAPRLYQSSPAEPP